MQRIFLHGLGQRAADWAEVTGALTRQEGVFCPDLFPLIAGKEAVYDSLYQAASACLDGAEEPLDLCGLSLGAVLALHYALDHPDRVRALALVCGQYRMPKKLLRLQSWLFRLMGEKSFQPMGLTKREVIALTRSMETLDFSQRLSQLEMPVLVVCGEADRANRGASEELAQRIPRAVLRLVPGAGHEVNRDAPEALATLVESFFDSVSA